MLLDFGAICVSLALGDFAAGAGDSCLACCIGLGFVSGFGAGDALFLFLSSGAPTLVQEVPRDVELDLDPSGTTGPRLVEERSLDGDLDAGTCAAGTDFAGGAVTLGDLCSDFNAFASDIPGAAAFAEGAFSLGDAGGDFGSPAAAGVGGRATLLTSVNLLAPGFEVSVSDFCIDELLSGFGLVGLGDFAKALIADAVEARLLGEACGDFFSDTRVPDAGDPSALSLGETAS